MTDSVFSKDFTKYVDKKICNYDNCMIHGYFNYDILNIKKSSPMKDLCEIFDITNLIKESTCKGATPSLVDVIFYE